MELKINNQPPISTYLLCLCLKGGRQHVGEEFQSYRKQELHEGNDDKHQERKKSEDISTCSEKLKGNLKKEIISANGTDLCKLMESLSETMSIYVSTPVWIFKRAVVSLGSTWEPIVSFCVAAMMHA